MTSASPGKEPTADRAVNREEEERLMTAESVLDEHEDLLQRLDQGDATALAVLLEAGGGTVSRATYKVTSARSPTP